MVRLPSIAIVLSLACLASSAEPTADEVRKKPITSAGGPLGDLLRQWWKEGTAAGNVDDWYDNRDRTHSELDRRDFPQLRKVQYSKEDLDNRRDWALQPRVLPHVVFGNSSTSALVTHSGSNVRNYYCSPGGLQLLHQHYRKNNLYIYPEHRDHDPGTNGLGDGYGDIYPTNTPYLITSQGSSGSDQPFMRAIPFTLAAFRPEVKKKLVETGLLMPTVQMIFRASNKQVGKGEYLSGKAHPTVFDGSQVDSLQMVKLAHDIRLDSIPPLVQLQIIEEESPVNGRDFFEPAGLTEQLATTPSVIARIWRGRQATRKLVVSAADSLDVNDKPLTFSWVVLRGDARRILINPRDKAGASAEISVEYHPRRPIAPGSAMDSNRVDIGVFAHNGVHYSAPAFITFFSLDAEGRNHDDKGRTIEIGYGMNTVELKSLDVPALFSALSKNELPAQMLGLSETQRQELAAIAGRAGPKIGERETLRQKRQKAEKQGNKAEQKELGDQFARIETEINNLLDGQNKVFPKGARPFVLQSLRTACARPTLWNDHLPQLLAWSEEPRRKASATRVHTARLKLQQLGIIADGTNPRIEFRPAREGREQPHERLSRFEKAMIEEFNGFLLSHLLLPGGLNVLIHTNFVDRRLTTPKNWRDVYQYEGDKLLGWKRYHLGAGKGVSEFTAEGLRITKKDEKGRALEARKVSYRWSPGKSIWNDQIPLEQVDGDEIDLTK